MVAYASMLKAPKIVTNVIGNLHTPSFLQAAKEFSKSISPPSPANEKRRRYVLSLYRAHHRAAAHQMDPLCRYFLRHHIWEHFLANAKEQNSAKIQKLIAKASENLHILKSGIPPERKRISKTHKENIQNKKSTEPKLSHTRTITRIMTYCYERINVVDGPLQKLLGQKVNNPSLTKSIYYMTRPENVDTLNEYKYQLHRAKETIRASYPKKSAESGESSEATEFTNPTESSEKLLQNPPHLYFRFMASLTSSITNPYSIAVPSSAQFKPIPLLEGTSTGEPLSDVREKNLVHETINTNISLKTSPFDPKVAHYIKVAFTSNVLSLGSMKHQDEVTDDFFDPHWVNIGDKTNRHYKRRLSLLAEDYYTVSYDENQIIKLHQIEVKTSPTTSRA